MKTKDYLIIESATGLSRAEVGRLGTAILFIVAVMIYAGSKFAHIEQSYLPEVGQKTLVIWGDHDRTYPWSQTAQLWQSIQDADLAVIPGCAHAVHLEKPHLFNTVLGDFLKS